MYRQLICLALLALVGCTSSQPEFDKATDYTVDSLAQELAFRLKDAKPSPAKKATGKAAKIDEKVQAKAKETTKEAAQDNIASIVDDIIKKAESIKTTPKAETLKAIAEKIKTDPAVTADQKTEVIAQLTGTES